MWYRTFLFLVFSHFLTAQNAPVVLNSSSLQVLYEIDASQRGTELLGAFNQLKTALTTNLFTPPVIEMQTTLPNNIPYAGYKGIYKNGIIPFVQTISGTTYNTLLLVSYVTPTYNTQYPFYIVLPVEQVTSLLYFQTISNLPVPSVATAPSFSAAFPPNVIPYYSVNPAHRAADIVSAVNQLRSKFTEPSLNQIWIQTGVAGPYRDPSTPNGLLKNVLSVSLVGNGLLQITFRPLDQTPQTTGTVYVSAEQVQQILYIRYYNNPTSP